MIFRAGTAIKFRCFALAILTPTPLFTRHKQGKIRIPGRWQILIRHAVDVAPHIPPVKPHLGGEALAGLQLLFETSDELIQIAFNGFVLPGMADENLIFRRFLHGWLNSLVRCCPHRISTDLCL